jgi:DNA-binding IclR family transcriptional regulator
MVKLSEETMKLLKEDILSILNETPERGRFGKEIAKELRRDKEFTLKLLLEMKELGWVKEFNGRGTGSVRKKWKISEGLREAWRE